jgi:CheY-like chemotaxis protein
VSRFILLVEDEPILSIALEELLTEAGYQVCVANNGGEALLAVNGGAARRSTLW